ncbi:MAG: respiratory nitrate reductase subunit gamma [Crenarchaeota archaeon]|nr:respiratory nitrate reductase subunit gamma [Thermoproteota archaeon]
MSSSVAPPSFMPYYSYYVNPVLVLALGMICSIIPFIILIICLYRMYQFVKPSLGDRKQNLIKAFFYTLIEEFVIHRNLSKCKPEWGRWILHQMVLWGMVILTGCTMFDAVAAHEDIVMCGLVNPYLKPLAIAFSLGELPPHVTAAAAAAACARVMHALPDPVKILYNIGGVLLVAGCIGLIVRRFTNKVARECVIAYDWYLLILLTFVGVSGFLAEILRMIAVSYWQAHMITLAEYFFYPGLVIYCAHLIAVAILFLSIPFTKTAHVAYRFVALLWVRYRGIRTSELVI